MPTNRRSSVAKHALTGGLAVVLATGALTAPIATASAMGGSGSPAADLAVVELDLAGIARAELDDLPDVPPTPAEQASTSRPADTTTNGPVLSVATSRALATVQADVRIQSAEAPSQTAPAQQPDVLTRPLPTEDFSVLGLSWDDTAEGVVVRYRVRVDGQWSQWDAVGASDVTPDDGGVDNRGTGRRTAADAIVAIGADGLQIWADAEDGIVTGLKAVLIDPGTSAGDARLPVPSEAQSETSGTAASTASARVVNAAAVSPRSEAAVVPAAAAYSAPAIITRSQWGADESLRNCEPALSTSLMSAAVHHTASTNGYTAADVPAMLRGFYAFHTRSEADGGRGWCDIGYNFLVDKFGRVFEGRAGSIDKTVIGAHTGGFNGRTVGVSAIGEYGAVAPTAALLEGISQTIAWKFSQLHISAGRTVTMVSGGSTSKFPEGTVVTFPTIYGHRDAGQTACPGQNLYDSLPFIRDRVASLVNAGVAASPVGHWDGATIIGDSLEVTGWVHDPDTRSPIQVAVEVNGHRATAVADGPLPDLAATVPSAGPAHGFNVRVPVPSGEQVACIWALNIAGGYDTMLGCRYANTPPAPTPVGVTAAKAGYGNVLAVNVNPNRGAASYSFRVQKRNANGIWATLPARYATEGAAETKSITLGAGTYRAWVPASGSYASAVSPAVKLTAPTVRAAVSTDSRKNNLIVNVDPNKGSGYWTFQVQRFTGGKWTILRPSYRTAGAAETRTLNLRAGKYRVKVAGKYGYLAAYTPPVTLTR